MSAREAWLKEHESVQDELSRMKQELMGDLIEKAKDTKKEQTPRFTGNENIKTLLAGKGDSLISRTTPTDADNSRTPPTRKAKEGEIPKHPELSNFVARVMERENIINKKIFKKEKEDRVGEAVNDRMHKEEEPESVPPPRPDIPQTDAGVSVDTEPISPAAADVSTPGELPVVQAAISTPSPSVTPTPTSPVSEPPVQDDRPKASTPLMPVRRSFPPPSSPVPPPQEPSAIEDGAGSEPSPPVQPSIQTRFISEQEPIPLPVQQPIEPQIPPEQESIPPPVQQPISPIAPSPQLRSMSPPGSDVNAPEEAPGQGDGPGMTISHPMGKVMVRRVIKKRE